MYDCTIFTKRCTVTSGLYNPARSSLVEAYELDPPYTTPRPSTLLVKGNGWVFAACQVWLDVLPEQRPHRDVHHRF